MASKKTPKRSPKRPIKSTRGKNTNRPDEYLKESTVTIRRALRTGEEPKMADGKGMGHTPLMAGFDLTKEHYFVSVRKVDGERNFFIIVEHNGVEVEWPDEVFNRVGQLRDRIISEQRSDRGKDAKVKRSETLIDEITEDIDMSGI